MDALLAFLLLLLALLLVVLVPSASAMTSATLCPNMAVWEKDSRKGRRSGSLLQLERKASTWNCG